MGARYTFRADCHSGGVSNLVIPALTRRPGNDGWWCIVRSTVMPAHSRAKDGVLSHAYVADIHCVDGLDAAKTWMAGTSPAMTDARLRDPHLDFNPI